MSLRKRTLALFMSIVMLVMLVPFNVFAAENVPYSGTMATHEQMSKNCDEQDATSVSGVYSGVSANDATNSTLNFDHELLGNESNETKSYDEETAMYMASRNTRSSLGDDAGNVTRDIVLVLDNSVSMKGTPLVNLKKAAIKFCTSVLEADGTNRVAIVAYDTNVSIATDFTNNLDTLSSSISSMNGKGSWTNITAGIQKADELLQASSASIRNILVMTDGVPTAGLYNSSGPYTYNDYSGTHKADHYVFEYANALYENMNPLLDKYNVYTLGFFHNTSKSVKNFASRVLNDIQNTSYYEVINPDDLEFTFGEVADDITQEQLKKLYTKQHITYYNGNFREEIQKISLPDEDGNSRWNTNYLLGNIVLDAAEDNVSKNYNAESIITDALNLNFDFVDGAISNYELILADIVTSSYYKDVLKEAYTASFRDDTMLLLKDIIDFGFENIDDMAQKANVSADILRQEWQTLAQTLDQMKICDNPDEFATLFGKCSVVVDKYIKADDQKKFLNSINGKKGYKGTALNAVLGATIDTATEMMTYYSCYDAYCTASDTFKEILSLIGFYADSVVQTGADGKPIYIGGLDEVFYSESLSIAVDNFLNNANDEATGAKQIAERFAKEGIENLSSSFAEAGVEILLDKIPIVKDLNNIRKIAGLTSASSMFIVDCATKIDDRAYAASMIYHLYFLANCTAKVADDCGEILVNQEDSEKAFEWAYRFDEAVRIWRCSSIMICDLGIEFENYCLQAAQKNLRPWPNSAMKKASWHSTAISIAALEKELLSNIHCHDVHLSYDPSSGVIDLGQNAQVITIACPVTVSVTDENGKQIALLADDVQTVAEGYEPYFHVLETERESKDYMKICYIPDTWNVAFTGTGNGTMHVLKANIVDGNIQNPIESPEVIISSGTEGHISHDDSENIVVIDNKGTYTITFDANGGKLTGDSAMSTGTDGKLLSLPANPTRDGNYTFNGWYTEAEDGTQVNTSYVFGADTTVYAQWTYTGSSGSGNNNSGNSGNGDISGDKGDSNIPGNVGDDNTSPTSSNSGDSSVTIDKSPNTGDSTSIQFWVVLLLIASAGIIVTIVQKGNKHMSIEK